MAKKGRGPQAHRGGGGYKKRDKAEYEDTSRDADDVDLSGYNRPDYALKDVDIDAFYTPSPSKEFVGGRVVDVSQRVPVKDAARAAPKKQDAPKAAPKKQDAPKAAPKKQDAPKAAPKKQDAPARERTEAQRAATAKATQARAEKRAQAKREAEEAKREAAEAKRVADELEALRKAGAWASEDNVRQQFEALGLKQKGDTHAMLGDANLLEKRLKEWRHKGVDRQIKRIEARQAATRTSKSGIKYVVKPDVTSKKVIDLQEAARKTARVAGRDRNGQPIWKKKPARKENQILLEGVGYDWTVIKKGVEAAEVENGFDAHIASKRAQTVEGLREEGRHVLRDRKNQAWVNVARRFLSGHDLEDSFLNDADGVDTDKVVTVQNAIDQQIEVAKQELEQRKKNYEAQPHQGIGALDESAEELAELLATKAQLKKFSKSVKDAQKAVWLGEKNAVIQRLNDERKKLEQDPDSTVDQFEELAHESQTEMERLKKWATKHSVTYDDATVESLRLTQNGAAELYNSKRKSFTAQEEYERSRAAAQGRKEYAEMVSVGLRAPNDDPNELVKLVAWAKENKSSTNADDKTRAAKILKNAPTAWKELGRKRDVEVDLRRVDGEIKSLRDQRKKAPPGLWEEIDEQIVDRTTRRNALKTMLHQTMKPGKDDANPTHTYSDIDPSVHVGRDRATRAGHWLWRKTNRAAEQVKTAPERAWSAVKPLANKPLVDGALTEIGDGFRLAAMSRLWKMQASRSARQANSAKMAQRKARSGLWRMWYQFSEPVRRVIVAAMILAPVMVPVGVFQFAGWMVFGLVTFILNVAYRFGIESLNLVSFGLMSMVNVGIQAVAVTFDNIGSKVVGFLGQCAGPAGSGCSYQPLEWVWAVREFKAAPLIDPRLFFPTRFNNNTILSELFTLAAQTPTWVVVLAIVILAAVVAGVMRKSDTGLRVGVAVMIGLLAVPAVATHLWGVESFYLYLADVFRTGEGVANVFTGARDALAEIATAGLVEGGA